jgi:hypothetical protein
MISPGLTAQPPTSDISTGHAHKSKSVDKKRGIVRKLEDIANEAVWKRRRLDVCALKDDENVAKHAIEVEIDEEFTASVHYVDYMEAKKTLEKATIMKNNAFKIFEKKKEWKIAEAKLISVQNGESLLEKHDKELFLIHPGRTDGLLTCKFCAESFETGMYEPVCSTTDCQHEDRNCGCSATSCRRCMQPFCQGCLDDDLHSRVDCDAVRRKQCGYLQKTNKFAYSNPCRRSDFDDETNLDSCRCYECDMLLCTHHINRCAGYFSSRGGLCNEAWCVKCKNSGKSCCTRQAFNRKISNA